MTIIRNNKSILSAGSRSGRVMGAGIASAFLVLTGVGKNPEPVQVVPTASQTFTSQVSSEASFSDLSQAQPKQTSYTP